MRKVIHIDEAKCDGCGQCVAACAEGAIQLQGGKAVLVKEQYCDGLAACIGECPEGAITMEEREAEAFDEAATKKHLETFRPKGPAMPPQGCPGARAFTFDAPRETDDDADDDGPKVRSRLRHWPVKIDLAPQTAPQFQGATLLLAADCAPFAYGGFHRDFLKEKALLTACPKFGNHEAQIDKLTAILQQNDVRGVEVVLMEVPCCFGLANVAVSAIVQSGKDLPLRVTKISLRGEVLQSGTIPVPAPTKE